MRLLLEHNADVNMKDNEYGWTALRLAARKGHQAVVRLLLEHRLVLWRLLEHKADINAMNNSGRTALHEAASKGYEAVVRLLLEHKVDVNTKDKDGWTALHQAA